MRAVLCDFHHSHHLADVSLAVDGLSTQSFAYSTSSRSGLLDALKDQQFAPDLRALLLLLIHLLLTHIDRGSALTRASASPSLQRVAEEEEEEGSGAAGTRKEDVYEAVDSTGPQGSHRRKSTAPKRRANGGFDNASFELREDLTQRHYENLPNSTASPAGSPTAESAVSELSSGPGGRPDLVRTAVEQRRRQRKRAGGSPSTAASATPRPPSTPAVLSHEEEYSLRLAREHPKWIDASALIGRDRASLSAVARAMRGVLSQLGADVSPFP